MHWTYYTLSFSRLVRSVMPLRAIWEECGKAERHTLDYSVHMPCCLCRRWPSSGSSHFSLSWSRSSFSFPDRRGSPIYLVDVWHIHRALQARVAKEVSFAGTLYSLLVWTVFPYLKYEVKTWVHSMAYSKRVFTAAGFTMWSLFSALLHALVCNMSRTPWNAGQTLWWCGGSHDYH